MMKCDASSRILVVGAGPTGMTVALELARRGMVPVVADVRTVYSSLSRAVGITPRSLAYLNACGADKQLIAESIEPEAMHIYRGSVLDVSLALHSRNAFHHTLLFLPQDRTEAILRDRLRALGGEVVYGRELVALEGNGPFTAGFACGSKEEFDIVIGADGVRSAVRQAAGIAFRGYELCQPWSIADVEASGWKHPADFTVSLNRRGISVIVPIGPGRYRLVSNTPDARAALAIPMTITHVHQEGTFQISVRQAATYNRGGVFLVGDAAHTSCPVGGRGMNTGIADAATLVACLAEGRADDYAKQRMRVGRKVLRETEIARRVMTGENWAARLVLQAVLGTARSFPTLRRRLGRYGVEF
ncbi:MAG: FAD-dependent oxidoreductase [Paracoccaceae bacterium]